VFRVYARGLGFEVGGGGRYDTLLGRFGRPFPAVGFMLGLDRVDLLLEREGASAGLAPEARVETIAEAGLAESLARARARRAAGARIRLGSRP
jgi:ATP phosphoribosyltransferase regulatory subunit